MTNNEIVDFFQLQRQIFGVCPNSGAIFRFSDCHVYLKKKPENDWLQQIEAKQKLIEKATEKLDEKEEKVKEQARVIGRKEATKAIKKIDTIFNPLKLNPDDSKVIFHPIDYIVFNGMKSGQMKNLIFMEKEKKTGSDKQICQSIIKVIEKENYEWITLRVEDDGNIKQE